MLKTAGTRAITGRPTTDWTTVETPRKEEKSTTAGPLQQQNADNSRNSKRETNHRRDANNR